MKRIRLIILVVILSATFMAGATLGHAQNTEIVPVSTPTVLSGTDLGFRVEARQGNALVGTLVVRVNGQWVETQYRQAVPSDWPRGRAHEQIAGRLNIVQSP
jgi:hypothetical protein